MQEDRNKATSQQKILVSLLVLANVSVAFFLLFGYRPKEGETLKQEIPSQVLLADELIKSRLFDLATKSNSGKAVMVILASASTTCSTGKVIDILNSHAQRTQNDLLVLLPSTYSQTDIDNFKVNLEVPYPVERADKNLSDRWLSLATKYNVTGVVLLIDNGEISVLQNLTEVDRRLLQSD
ncbi:MAG TPA: hypothetical protein VN844_01145 [Pyrinomonadaceae bacterium]|nr:hypothetical protein [Pyrinomonadaceae bacterium]